MDPTTKRIREYDRLAQVYDQRLGLYTRQSIEAALKAAHLVGKETILDACCGTGELLHDLALAEHQGRIVGVDYSQTMLNVATHHLRPYSNITLKQASIDKLDMPGNYFDVAFITNAFHYLDHPDETLLEMHRVLLPHGRLIIADLVADSLVMRIWFGIRRFFSPHYYRLYRVSEITELLKKHNFLIKRKQIKRLGVFWTTVMLEAEKN